MIMHLDYVIKTWIALTLTSFLISSNQFCAIPKTLQVRDIFEFRIDFNCKEKTLGKL